MRKRVFLLLSFVLALAMSIGVLTACGGGKSTVEIRQGTALTLAVGQSQSLSATASNGSDIEWSSDAETVVTVNENGRVTAVAAGTANITASAKKGGGSASISITAVGVTFKQDGTAVTEASVDMLQNITLTVETSDNSSVTWSSEDEEIATVSGGVVTGVLPGETNIQVTTSSGVKASIPLTVNAAGDYQEITPESRGAGQWWYYTNEADNRSTIVTEHYYLNNEVHYAFNGNGNWYIDDIQLGHVAPNGTTAGWKKVTGKITLEDVQRTDEEKLPANTPIQITIFDTAVTVEEGENDFVVYYQQMSGSNDMFIRFAGGATLISGANVTLSDLVWEDHTTAALETPTFQLGTEGEISITDEANTVAGSVRAYQIGLFASQTATVPTYSQNFSKSGGKLDTSAVEPNGTYFVKVRALANAGYTDSEWSALNTEITYEVNNTNVAYELAHASESGATGGRWVYFCVDGGSVSETPTYDTGVVTLKSKNLGRAFWSTQMFRKYDAYATGADLKITMNINASHAGHITITGTKVKLEKGDNEIELFIKNPAGATISIQFGVNGANPPVDFVLDSDNENDEFVFVFSNVVVEEFVPEALKTPSASYAKEGDNDPVVTVTDNENDEANVSGYEVGFFDADDKLIGTAAIDAQGNFNDKTIKDGTYSLKVRAVPSKAAYTHSEWTAAITTGYEISYGFTTTEIANGSETGQWGDASNSIDIPDTWLLWSDGPTFTARTLTVTTGTNEETLAISYTNNTKLWYGAQLFYKNSELKEGQLYKLTAKINSSVACKVTLKGTVLDLVAGDNNITVYYTEANNAASFALQFGVDPNAVEAGSFTISNVAWAEYTNVALTAPTIAIAEDGTVTINDTNEAGVASYVAGFFKEDKVVASVPVANGEKLDVSVVESGEYQVKLMAKAIAGYADSAWSEAVSYTVVNEGGVSYDLGLTADDSHQDQYTDKFGLWAVQQSWNLGGNVDVSSAKYENNTVTITFTATGNCAFGLQIKYKNTSGASSVSFDIEASSEMNAKVGFAEEVTSNVTLAAGVQQSLTLNDSYFYVEIDTSKTTGGTITISNVQWN